MLGPIQGANSNPKPSCFHFRN